MFVRSKKVKRFLRGCHRMRSRYRQIVEKVELGWRMRYDRKVRELHRQMDKEREQLQDCVRRMSTIDPEAHGNMTFGIRPTFNQEMFKQFQPGQEDELIRYWAQDVGHMLEREIRQLNFSLFASWNESGKTGNGNNGTDLEGDRRYGREKRRRKVEADRRDGRSCGGRTDRNRRIMPEAGPAMATASLARRVRVLRLPGWEVLT